MQVIDLKDRSPLWVKALLVKDFFTLSAGAT
jgi:hypothetical protein